MSTHSPVLSSSVLRILIVGVLLTSCGKDSPTASNKIGPPAQLTIVGGDGQTTTAGTELPNPLVVRVVDADGHAIAGQAVNFRVTAGGGSVFAGTSVTNADGIAQERWTLGTVARVDQTVEARAVDNSTGQALVFATFHATAAPDAPSALSIVRQPAASAKSGQPLSTQPSVQLVDKYGNAVTRSGVQISASIVATQDARSLTGIAVVTTDDAGVATFADLAIVGGAGAVSLAFTASGMLSVSSSAISLTAGAPTQLVVVGPTTFVGAVGAPLATLPRVAVRDAAGNAVAGVTVNFAVSNGGGAIAPTSVTTNDNGEAALTSWTLPTQAGNAMVVATSSPIGGASVTFTATAQPATGVRLVGVNTADLAGEVGGSLPVILRLTDQYGNAIPGAIVNFAVGSNSGTVSTDGQASAATAATTSDASGEINAVWTLSIVAGQQTLIATSSSSPAGLTLTAAARPGSPTRVVLDRQPSATTSSGTAFAVQPIALLADQFGNSVAKSGVVVTASVSAPYTIIGTPGATTDPNGRATFVGLGVTGAAGDVAIAFGAPSLTSATATVKIVASTPSTMSIVSGDNQTGVVGQELSNPLAVRVLDANGQPVQGQAVNFRVTAGGGSVFAGTANTNADGVAQERWTLGTVAGSTQTLEARAVDNTTGAPVVFATFHATANAGPAAALTIVTQPGNPARSGTAFLPQPTVRLVDKYGNLVSQSGVQIMASSGSVVTLTNVAATTDATGVANYTALTPQGPTGPFTVTFSSPGLASITSISIQLTVGATYTWIGGHGSTPQDWSDPQNWSPAIVPGPADTALINPSASPPHLNANTEVSKIVVDAATGMNLLGYNLTASELRAFGAIVSTTGAVVMSRAGGALSGTIPRLLVSAATTIDGTTIVTGDVTVTGTLTLPSTNVYPYNDNNLTTQGNLVVQGPAAHLQLLKPTGLTDSLVVTVNGTATFDGGDPVVAGQNADYHGGILELKGDLIGGSTYTPRSLNFVVPATGGSEVKVRFSGSGRQRLTGTTTFSPDGNHSLFAFLEVNKTSGTVAFEIPVAAHMALRVLTPTVIEYPSTGTLAVGNELTINPAADLGQVGTLELYGGPIQQRAPTSTNGVAQFPSAGARQPHAVLISGSNVSFGVSELASPLTVTGHLFTGNMKLDSTFTVTGPFAYLEMLGLGLDTTGTRLRIDGTATFDGLTPNLIGGVIDLKSDLVIGRTYSTKAFLGAAWQKGTFYLEFSGTAPQTIRGPGVDGSSSNESTLGNVIVGTTANLTVPTVPANELRQYGTFTVPAGITFGSRSVHLYGGSVTTVNGTLTTPSGCLRDPGATVNVGAGGSFSCP